MCGMRCVSWIRCVTVYWSEISSSSISSNKSRGNMFACLSVLPAFFQSVCVKILLEWLWLFIQSHRGWPDNSLSFGIVQKPARCPMIQELRIAQSVLRTLAFVLRASVLNQNSSQSVIVRRQETLLLRCRYSLNSATVSNGTVVNVAISYVRVPTRTFLDSNDERSGLRFMS